MYTFCIGACMHVYCYMLAGYANFIQFIKYCYVLSILLQGLLDEADRVDGYQLLLYDTTFLLGDFYVLLLVFRHTVFHENPCIPAMFLLHERKLHQEMFCGCIKCTPSLKCPLVMDKEQAMVYAAKSLLPEISLVHVHCWNNLFQDIRY